ncbi:hypothetical protein GGX14DRAFT_557622 [Mycena pura]|uniref:Uncharacterized protein n=1 Tax=Mycena pura TaxID=153505 RepID=A0AAD7E0R0_9AGAR|nr:hypothetical protein GGX14DRAFT_557622 [Mycena pura]
MASKATTTPKPHRGRPKKKPVTPGPSDAPTRNKTDKPYRVNLGRSTLGPSLVTRTVSKSKEKPESEEEEREESEEGVEQEEEEEERAEEVQEDVEEQGEDTEDKQEASSPPKPANNLHPLNHWQPHFDRRNARFLQGSQQRKGSPPRNNPQDIEETPVCQRADLSASRARTQRQEPSGNSATQTPKPVRKRKKAAASPLTLNDAEGVVNMARRPTGQRVSFSRLGATIGTPATPGDN